MLSDMFVISVMGPTSSSRLALTMDVGRGSSRQDFGGEVRMILAISSSDDGVNEVTEN